MGLQVNDQFLTVKFFNGDIVIHELESLERIQIINEMIIQDETIRSFYLRNEILVGVDLSPVDDSLLVVRCLDWSFQF